MAYIKKYRSQGAEGFQIFKKKKRSFETQILKNKKTSHVLKNRILMYPFTSKDTQVFPN